MADSLGDRQFPPKLPASAWSGTFWSHRRADQEALTLLCQHVSLGPEPRILEIVLSRVAPKGALCRALATPYTSSFSPRPSRKHLIWIKGVCPGLLLFPTQLPRLPLCLYFLEPTVPSAHLRLPPGVSPHLQQRIYAFPNTRTGSLSHHRLVLEVQRLRQAWVGAISTFQSSHPCGWLADGGILAAWGGDPEKGWELSGRSLGQTRLSRIPPSWWSLLHSVLC